MRKVLQRKALAAIAMIMIFVCCTMSTACKEWDNDGITMTAAQSPIETPEETNRHVIDINPSTTSGETTTIVDETTTGKVEQQTTMMGHAEKLLSEMSLEEKVGQMFIARCPKEDAAKKAADYNLGGYILFGRDFKDKTKEQVIQNIADIQGEADIALLIGVDEEGGTVNRVSRYTEFRSEPFKSPQELYSLGGLEAIKNDVIEKSELLKSLGINLNFAPVCDVTTNPKDFMYDRAFGLDAEETAEFVELVVQMMSERGMGSVLKHFPGYGDNVDTHTGVAYDNRPYETFVSSDFLPFQAGIEAGADVVLVSHNIVNSIDSEYPASLSPKVHEILRDELGFTGVIVTDDLAMEGVSSFADDAKVAVLAVKAGNDLLCCTNFEEQIPAVIEAVKRGEILEEQINASVFRILQMKISLGIIEIDL